MSLASYQKHLRDVCLARETSTSDLAALGAEPWRWQAYRRMVRARFYETIEHCYGRVGELLGGARFHERVDRFFAESAPRSLYLRDIPGEFLAFLESDADGATLPAMTLDLARLEWAELDTAYSFEEVRAADVVPFDMALPVALTPAHRILRLTYPVHRTHDAAEIAALAPSPIALCLYREPHTHDITTLELTPVAASLLLAMGQPHGAFSDVVREVAAKEGAAIDVAFVEALSTLLADFIERGIVLGSSAVPR